MRRLVRPLFLLGLLGLQPLGAQAPATPSPAPEARRRSNNLDPEGVALLTDWLRARRPGHSLLVISHDAEFMAAICDESLDITSRHVNEPAPEAAP